MLDIDKYFEEVSHKIHEMSDEEFENLLIKCDLINENFQVDDIVYFKRGLAPEGYENKQLIVEECLKTKLKLKRIKPHYWSKYLLTKNNNIEGDE